MGFRPEFDDRVLRSSDTVTVVGRMGDGPPPAGIHVFLEQGATVAGGAVEDLAATWRADLPAAGFTTGPALAFGIEMRTKPFQAITWSETVTIA
jgi:hypothetical protein